MRDKIITKYKKTAQQSIRQCEMIVTYRLTASVISVFKLPGIEYVRRASCEGSRPLPIPSIIDQKSLTALGTYQF